MVDATAFFDAIKSGQRHAVHAALERDPALATARDDQRLSPILVALYHLPADRADPIARDIAAHAADLDVFEASALSDANRVRDLVDRDPALANAYNVDGFNPLGLAAFFKRGDVVRALLRAGADPNAPSRNAFAFTPLHSAIATNGGAIDMTLIRALVEAGADVNARSAQGSTVLHTAAFVGDATAARYFLERGADPNARTNDGRTPLDVARERQQGEIARLLAAR